MYSYYLFIIHFHQTTNNWTFFPSLLAVADDKIKTLITLNTVSPQSARWGAYSFTLQSIDKMAHVSRFLAGTWTCFSVFSNVMGGSQKRAETRQHSVRLTNISHHETREDRSSNSFLDSYIRPPSLSMWLYCLFMGVPENRRIRWEKQKKKNKKNRFLSSVGKPEICRDSEAANQCRTETTSPHHGNRNLRSALSQVLASSSLLSVLIASVDRQETRAPAGCGRRQPCIHGHPPRHCTQAQTPPRDVSATCNNISMYS